MHKPRVDTFVPGSFTGTRTAASENSHAAGHSAGYAAGYAAGSRAAAAAAAVQAQRNEEDHARREAARDLQVAQAIQALRSATEQWRAMATPVLAESDVVLQRGAIDVAQAVLTHELRSGPDTAKDVLQRALALPVGVTPTAIRLSEADLVHVERLIADGQATLPAGITLSADPSLAPGDAITEHPHGVLDARISAAIARARAALEESP